jgi:hypothetical protein
MLGMKNDKQCPRCNGLGETYYILEGDSTCRLCKGTLKVSNKVFKKYQRLQEIYNNVGRNSIEEREELYRIEKELLK